MGEATHDGQPVRVVSGSATFATEPVDLWNAVTTTERLPQWFLPISGDLKEGGRYQLKGHAGGVVTRCDAPAAFDITWECGDNVSWIRVRLAGCDDGTRLTLEHTMPKDEAGEEHWRKYGAGATGVGWDLSFVGLHLHVQTGETVPQAESHAWMASDSGKAFIRECASAWGDAHIESGEDETVARAMADQTAKFYCGESCD